MGYQGRCRAFAKSPLQLNVDEPCHLSEAATEALAEPVAHAASATQPTWPAACSWPGSRCRIRRRPPPRPYCESLIDRHGPPLVLKSDNGSAFQSEEFGELLAGQEIVWPPSPARTPRYNGSCEAGNGSMRTRTGSTAGWHWLCQCDGRVDVTSYVLLRGGVRRGISRAMPCLCEVASPIERRRTVSPFRGRHRSTG